MRMRNAYVSPRDRIDLPLNGLPTPARSPCSGGARSGWRENRAENPKVYICYTTCVLSHGLHGLSRLAH